MPLGLILIVAIDPYFIVFILLAVFLRCTGGEVGATSALAPKIGPLGLVCLDLRFLN